MVWTVAGVLFEDMFLSWPQALSLRGPAFINITRIPTWLQCRGGAGVRHMHLCEDTWAQSCDLIRINGLLLFSLPW